MSEIGHNAPPAFEACSLNIEELFEQATHFLDGDPIANDEQARAVGKLRDMCRDAWKAADALRADEKRPHDDASKAAQAKWKPLLDRADLAKRTAEKALAPYLQAKEAEQRRIADEARREAEEVRRKAQEARQASEMDLAARMNAETLLKAADASERKAAQLAKAKPQVAGEARAIGLRTAFVPELVDPMAALRFYRDRQPEALKAWLLDQAAKDVRNGMREIPGFAIKEERKAA